MLKHRSSIAIESPSQPSRQRPRRLSIRWRALENADRRSENLSERVMSSPDPLREADITIQIPTSHHRVNHSQRTASFASPIKKTFQLQVGNSASLERPLATVDTENDKHTSTLTRPRPLPSPGPSPGRKKRSMSTTTTRIPLKESVEDEAIDETPRGRGRPRKSNGTPMPGAGRKRKAGTPIRQLTPGRPSTFNEPDPLSDPAIQMSPTPRRHPRNLHIVEPSSEIGFGSSIRQGAKRRRHALGPEEMEELAEEDVPTYPRAAQDDEDVNLIEFPLENAARRTPSRLTEPHPPSSAGGDSDIWMATMSPERTPRPTDNRRKPQTLSKAASSKNHGSSVSSRNLASRRKGYTSGAAGRSDISEAESLNSSSGPPNNDTIAQGEDFSMIFMDSIQSYQDFKSSIAAPAQNQPERTLNDIGEETSAIINNSLASFRESLREQATTGHETTEEHHDFDVQDQDQDQNQVYQLADEMDIDSPYHQNKIADLEDVDLGPPRPEMKVIEMPDSVRRYGGQETGNVYALEQHDVESIADSDAESEASHQSQNSQPSEAGSYIIVHPGPQNMTVPEAATPTPVPNAALPIMGESPIVSSANRAMRWAKSPWKGGLLQKVFKGTPRGRDEEASSPGLTASPRRGKQLSRVQQEDYEDSFSEIPREVLVAATPRPPSFDDYTRIPPGAGSEILEGGSDFGEDENEVENEAEADDLDNYIFDANVQPQRMNNPDDPSNAHESSKLPTPDETPPNLESTGSPNAPKVASVAPEEEAEEEEEDANAQLASEHAAMQSPVMALPEHSRRTVTPPNQISSPAEQPSSMGESAHAHEKASRPTNLEAIVRASRVMQSVTSDPPSPEANDKQLGSPFRSSASKDSPRGLASTPARHGGPFSARRIEGEGDDPFATEANTLNQSGPRSFRSLLAAQASRAPAPRQESPAYSPFPLGPRKEPRKEPSQGSIFGTVSRQPQTRPEFEVEGEFLPKLERDPVLKPTENQKSAQRPEPESVQSSPQPGDDMTNIWDIEAERSRVDAHPDAGASTRREDTSPKVNQSRSSSADDRMGLAFKRSLKRSLYPALPGHQGRPFDLSTFFSPPAAIHGSNLNAPPGLGSPYANTGSPIPYPPLYQQPRPMYNPVHMQTSSMFPPHPSRVDAFAESRQYPTTRFVPVAQMEEPEPESREEVLRKARLEKAPARHIPDELPQPSPSILPTGASQHAQVGPKVITPPRMQRSVADIRKWQWETSEDASDRSDQGRDDRSKTNELRTLPPRNASPRKSSMRSPMKPHTAGRVVDFNSSVLSPAQQAEIRRQRRASMVEEEEEDLYSASPRAPRPVQTQPKPVSHPKPQEEPIVVADDDEEEQEDHDDNDQPSDFDSSHVAIHTDNKHSKSVLWSAIHWRNLEALIRRRRQAPLTNHHHSFPTSVALKGKFITVANVGGMCIEQWHIECIDAFASRFPGFTTGEVARKLACLIIAGARREERNFIQNEEEMFH